jgi:hypothetical protein
MQVVHFSVVGCRVQSTARSGFMPGYVPEKVTQIEHKIPI